MPAADALLSGRQAAERQMTSACLVNRITEGSLDDDLDYSESSSVVYAGRCELKFATNRVQSRDVESQVFAAQQLLLKLPIVGSEDIAIDDEVTITDGGLDPALTGRTFRVTGLFSQTYATSRRIPIESLS